MKNQQSPNKTKNEYKSSGIKELFVGGVLSAGLFSVMYFAGPFILSSSYIAPINNDGAVVTETEQVEDDRKQASDVMHLDTPEPLRAIYMTQCVVGTPDFRERLVRLIEETELNSVVIDVKDYSGTIGFPAQDPRFTPAVLTSCGAYDMKAFLKYLHEKDIYTIARITVFQDPHYAKRFPDQAVQSVSRPGEPWRDYKGLSFIDVSSEPFWDYIVTLGKESYAIGFDELNFDYIRYPSDGPMRDAAFVNTNKADTLERFFAYLYKEFEPTGAVLSADIFGYTTVLTDDLGIGQQLERTLPYFDYVAPMVYPSHYNKGFAGLENPNDDPYKVVHTSMLRAVQRAIADLTVVKTLNGEVVYQNEVVPATETQATTTRMVATGLYTKEVYDQLKLRPWLQDFDYGGDYDVEEVRAQIQATYDAGLTSWMLWSPSNIYTRGALEPAE